ncbi:hypothetical protein Hanom_Chr17g01578371 [Helianthus anomalus]
MRLHTDEKNYFLNKSKLFTELILLFLRLSPSLPPPYLTKHHKPSSNAPSLYNRPS